MRRAAPSLLLLALAATHALAQDAPTRDGPGRVDVRMTVERHGDLAQVTVAVDIEAGWHIYGLRSEYGVKPTLELRLPAGVAPIGTLVESLPVRELALDELPITAHRGSVAFVHTLSLADRGPKRVEARFAWQVCDDPDRYCAPGSVDGVLVVPDTDGRAPPPNHDAPGLDLDGHALTDDGSFDLRARIDAAPGGAVLKLLSYRRSTIGGDAEGWEVTVRPPPGVELVSKPGFGRVELRGVAAAGAPVELEVRWTSIDSLGEHRWPSRTLASLPWPGP